MIFFDYEFEAPVELYDFGRMAYTVVYLPREIEQELPFDEHPRLRINAEVNDYPLEGAWQPGGKIGDGRYYLILSRHFLKQIESEVGSVVEVRFGIADQNHVDVPEELERALAEEDEARAAWEQMTPGKQRAVAHRVDSAKRAETRAKRVAGVLEWLNKGTQDIRELG